MAACSAGPPSLTVTEAWTRPAAEGNNAAVYFVINNRTPADLNILSASTNVARAVEIHQSVMLNADELDGMIEGGADEMQMQDVMQMAPLSSVELPSKSSLIFAPGSYHIMLIDLKHELPLGESLLITLGFDNAEDLLFDVLIDER